MANRFSNKSQSNFEHMPSMDNCDPEELFTCPYDPVHRVAAKRLPYHLQKCRKNYIGSDKSTCPFNARHIVPSPEYRHHVANCADRSTIEQDMAFAQTHYGTDGSYLKGDTSVPSYHHDYEPVSSENWDTEASYGRRNTSRRQTQPAEVHSLDRMSAAQKQELNRKILAASNMRNSARSPQVYEVSAQPELEEIRRPKQPPLVVAATSQKQNSMVHNGVAKGASHGPIGLGRAMLFPNGSAMPTPGTGASGRSIAANIFNSQDCQSELDSTEAAPRRATTISVVSINTAQPAPNTHAQMPQPHEFPNLSKLEGLGRGLGQPRGGYRPGLGMPAVGQQAAIQTNEMTVLHK